MVRKDTPVYLFIGQDAHSKDIRLKKIKEEFLDAHTQYFNLDVLYAKELALKDLQERLLSLPLRAKKRIVIIKDGQNLKGEVKEFITKYVKHPLSKVILVLDINKYAPQDGFLRQIRDNVQVCLFKEEARIDTFALSRAIDYKKSSYALWLLNQLLKNGEKAERILGGLRYSWENNVGNVLYLRKKLRLLLGCDIDIKTGRLRPDFALERLVVNLCSLAKPSG